MGLLEKRSFEGRKRVTLIKPNDETAPLITKILARGIKKGNHILRCGRSSNYAFRFDSIY